MKLPCKKEQPSFFVAALMWFTFLLLHPIQIVNFGERVQSASLDTAKARRDAHLFPRPFLFLRSDRRRRRRRRWRWWWYCGRKNNQDNVGQQFLFSTITHFPRQRTKEPITHQRWIVKKYYHLSNKLQTLEAEQRSVSATPTFGNIMCLLL